MSPWGITSQLASGAKVAPVQFTIHSFTHYDEWLEAMRHDDDVAHCHHHQPPTQCQLTMRTWILKNDSKLATEVPVPLSVSISFSLPGDIFHSHIWKQRTRSIAGSQSAGGQTIAAAAARVNPIRRVNEKFNWIGKPFSNIRKIYTPRDIGCRMSSGSDGNVHTVKLGETVLLCLSICFMCWC